MTSFKVQDVKLLVDDCNNEVWYRLPIALQMPFLDQFRIAYEFYDSNNRHITIHGNQGLYGHQVDGFKKALNSYKKIVCKLNIDRGIEILNKYNIPFLRIDDANIDPIILKEHNLEIVTVSGFCITKLHITDLSNFFKYLDEIDIELNGKRK